MKYLIAPLVLLILVGCKSDVDKCVDAALAGYGWKSDLKDRAISIYEHSHRLKCMGIDEKERFSVVPINNTSGVVRLDLVNGEMKWCYPSRDPNNELSIKCFWAEPPAR